jgi:RNA polymerase sigma-54 factor
MSIELNQQLQPMMQAKVTPKQIAANYILQMSSVELQEAIAQELDENPALEMDELPTCPICSSPIMGNYCTECMPRKGEGEDPANLSVDDLPGDSASRVRDEDDEFDPIARAEADFTLEDHLMWSLHAQLPSSLHHVADHVIGALDSNGFLTQTDAEIAATTGVRVADVEEVLSAMKGLEPIGIGSRSITESLLAQIEYLREQDEMEVPPYAEAVVGEHLADLGRATVSRGGRRHRRQPEGGHRRLGVREGQPQPVSDRRLHCRRQRGRAAHDHPSRRPHSRDGR